MTIRRTVKIRDCKLRIKPTRSRIPLFMGLGASTYRAQRAFHVHVSSSGIPHHKNLLGPYQVRLQHTW